MEEIVSLPPMEFFNNDYQSVLDFIEDLGNPKFKIAGHLNLRNTDIESLGDLVEVDGNLDLNSTKITSLPDNLYIIGFLFLSNTEITSLPNNLHVGCSLFLEDTPLSEKYSVEEIKKMIEDKGGFVKRFIYI